MWLLSILPSSWLQVIIYGIFLVGIGMYIASFFADLTPDLVVYKEPFKLAAVGCLLFGIYAYGCFNTEIYWRNKVTESQVAYQAKIDAAKIELKDVTTALIAEQKKKLQVIIDHQIVVKEKIVKITEQIDAACKVDGTAIEVLNDAATYPVKENK